MSIHVIFSFIALSLFLTSCAIKQEEPLVVRQFHLRGINPDTQTSQMIRGEQQYRLLGAVSNQERRARLGQYYTVHWKKPLQAEGALRIVMDYEQSATGAKKLSRSHELPSDSESGTIEFHITGEDYRRNGRVLAWRMRLMSGQQVLDEKRSYLWR